MARPRDGLHLYVPDADRVYRDALDAGAESLYGPVDQPYGDREAGVKDVAGNHWYIATHLAGGHIPPGLGTVTTFLHPRGAGRLIEFMKDAFAAEEIAIHRGPDGAIAHAQIRMGRSVIEMGEAHGEWGPMPTMFYMYVDDVDAWYGRALQLAPCRWRRPRSSPTAIGEPRCATPSTTSGTWLRQQPLDGGADTARLAEHRSGLPLVLVTHGSVVTDLTGLDTKMGEFVVRRAAADGSHAVAGRLYVE